MALTNQEFLVLKELIRSNTRIGRSDIDTATGLSPKEVDAAFASLEGQGLVEEGCVTAAAVEALEPYRVRNAIILAAGMSTRFAPIAYDIPKGLVKVKGEVLIERQIRQLHEAGIYDITLVVGHRKEKYAYLALKYGVSFVENPDYAVTNTCRSLYFARDLLSRTYVLFSDTYFISNPFERYAWEGYYATQPLEGHDNEWRFISDDEGYVCRMVKGGDEGECTGGFAMLDEPILKVLVPIIEREQGNWKAMTSFWETMWEWNVDTVKIRTKLLPASFSFEFDSMDDLFAFDPDYLSIVPSPSLDNICNVLACTREQICDCYPLTAGLTNVSCHFRVGEREYVYRHPMDRGGRFSDRADETKIEKEALRVGLDKTFVYEDPSFGWKICRFIPNAIQCAIDNPVQHRVMAKMLGDLHRLEGLSSIHTCSRWGIGMHFEKNMVDRGTELPEWYVRGRNKGLKLYEYAKADNFPMVFSHNDAWYGNFLIDEEGNYNLIDWEFAMMADEGDDIGYMTGTTFATKEDIAEMVTIYLGRKPTKREFRHYAAHTMHTGVYQAAWALDFKDSAEMPTDWPIDAWLVQMEEYLDKELDWVVDLYENPEDDLDAEIDFDYPIWI